MFPADETLASDWHLGRLRLRQSQEMDRIFGKGADVVGASVKQVTGVQG